MSRNHNGNANPIDRQKAGQAPMNQVSQYALSAAFVARLVDLIDPRKPAPSEVVRAAQLACGRWLAQYRERTGLTVVQIAERTGVGPQQIEWIEWGQADPHLLSDAGCDDLSRVLAQEEPDDIASIKAVLMIALGQAQEPNPRVMAWVLEDLKLGDLVVQPIPVAHTNGEISTPAQPHVTGRVLDLDEILVLFSLAGGERPSYDIWQDVVMRRPAGEKEFDNAASVAVIARAIDEGWIEQVAERFDSTLGMARPYFRLTSLGQQVLAAERKRVERLEGRPYFMQSLLNWLAGMGAVRSRPLAS
jgi:transcriptional regulator with XRE-family HTH domain